MTIRYCFILICSVTVNVAVSQTDVKSRAPKVVPPSPHAASLGKYGDIPVSPYTGVPGISIPLYEIRSGDIVVPISISYHASGIKVHEEASRIGLGWALAAGGLISRTIYGMDDFSITPEAYHKATSAPEFGAKPLIYNNRVIQEGCDNITLFSSSTETRKYLGDGVDYDFQPDHYSYNFLGYSGKFIFNRDKTLVFNKSEKIKFEVHDEEGKSWTVKTDNGFTYLFENFETYRFEDGELAQEHISSWYLTEIQSQKGNRVKFNYKLENNYTKTVGSWYEEKIVTTFQFVPKESDFRDAGGKCLQDHEPGHTLPGKQYKNLFLESIEFEEGKVQFNYDTRSDLENDNRITSIVISKKELPGDKLVEIRRWELNHSYFQGSGDPDYLPDAPMTFRTHRLKLLGLREISADGRLKKPYRFTYYGDETASSQLPAKTSFARDHWGYFNGKFSNASLIPTFDQVQSDDIVRFHMGVIEDNRDTDPLYAKAFTLKEIVYPTGGATEFQYESHTYDHLQSKVNDHSYYKTYIDIEQTRIHDMLNGKISGTQSVKLDLTNLYVAPNATAAEFSIEMYFRFTNVFKSCNINNGNIFFQIVNAAGEEEVQNEVDVNGSNDKTCDEFRTGPNPEDVNYRGIKIKKKFLVKPGIYYFNLRIAYNPDKEFDPTNGNTSGQSVQDVNVDVFFKKTKVGIANAGGLRIKKIIDKESADPAKWITKNYVYNNGTDAHSYGKLMSRPQYSYFTKFSQVLSHPMSSNFAEAVCHQLVRSSDSHLVLNGSAGGSVVGYDQVTVLIGDNGEYGKTIYEYHNTPDHIWDYSVVDDFDIGGNTISVVLPQKFPQISGVPDLRNGLIKKQTDYAYESGNFTKIRELEYAYQDSQSDPNNTFVYGLEVRKPWGKYLSITGCRTLNFIYPSFQFNWVNLYESRERLFDNGKVSETVTQFFYQNPVHLQLTKTISAVNNQKKNITIFKYPADYEDAQSSAAIMSMKGSSFMHGAVIEKVHMVENKGINHVVSGEVAEYDFFSGKLLQKNIAFLETANPIKEEDFTPYDPVASISESSYKVRMKFDYYPTGNLKLFEKAEDLPVFYLWGYKDRYPVAEVKNAALDEVYYTSFEDNGTEDILKAKAGRRYQPSGYTFMPPPDLKLRNSILSYWYHDNDGWHLKRRPYAGGSIVINDGDRIDELRIVPSDGYLLTYTYDPLTGLSAVGDINNQTTQYE